MRRRSSSLGKSLFSVPVVVDSNRMMSIFAADVDAAAAGDDDDD